MIIPFSSQVVKIFKQDFNGLTPEEVFATFDTEPVASASIAQVHKATLKDGTVVAVKVQKPYIRWQMGFDLLCYKILCHAFEFAFDLPVVWSVDFTSRHLRAEADFENEARSAERAYAELMKEPKLRDDVYVPRVHWDLTSKRVMTAEWIEGIPLVRTRDVSQAFDKKWVVQKVVDTFSHQIFQSGWVHADPHPGNLMVRRVNGKPQLVLLDHGLYVEETPAFINTYAEFWRALLLADISALERICESWGIRDVKMMSSATLQRPFDPERAKREGRSALEKPTLEEIYRMQTEVKEKAKEFLSDTGRIPRELIFVGRNMNLVRAVNKSYGSPVDRVGEMSRWAVSAFTKAPISSYNTMSLMSQRSPSVFGVRDYFSSLFVYLRFNAALFVVSVGFAATKVWAWVQGNILRRDKVKNYEELLEDQARDIMAQYGMLLPEDAFDA